MAEFDLTQLLVTDLPARIRSGFTVAELPTIGTADELHQAMLLDAPLPAVYPIHVRGPAKPGPTGGRRLVMGHRKQLVRVRVSIAVVTESYGPTEEARLGAWPLMYRVEQCVVGWKSPEMLKSFEFLDDPFVMRSPDGTRVLHEIQIEGEAERFTTLLAP